MNGKDIDPFGAADVSWVFYEHNIVYSSNVLVQSGLARRPVIARRQGLIGRLVEDHKLGLALTSEEPEIVASALQRLAENPTLRREMGENGARAFAKNTPENFARPIIDGMNAGTDSEVITEPIKEGAIAEKLEAPPVKYPNHPGLRASMEAQRPIRLTLRLPIHENSAGRRSRGLMWRGKERGEQTTPLN